MSERLNDWAPDVLRALVVVLGYAVVGAACGRLWFELWGPPTEGVVVPFEGRNIWVPEPYIEGYAVEFSGTGHYVVIGCVAGLLLGLVAGALVHRREVLVLVAALAGSLLAAWLMYLVGESLSPPDPTVLARTSEPDTVLEAALVVRGTTPYLAWPIGTCLGLCAAFVAIVRSRPASVAEPDDWSEMPR